MIFPFARNWFRTIWTNSSHWNVRDTYWNIFFLLDKKQRHFAGVPSKVWDGRRDPSQSSGAPWGPTRCLESPFPDHVRDHLAPPKQPEPTRAPRGERSPEGPWGLPRPRSSAPATPLGQFLPPPIWAVLPNPRGTGGPGAGLGGVPWSTPALAGPPPRQGRLAPGKSGCWDRLPDQHAGWVGRGSRSRPAAAWTAGLRAPWAPCLPLRVRPLEAEWRGASSPAAPRVPHSGLLCYGQHPRRPCLPCASESGTTPERLRPSQAGCLSGLRALPGPPFSSPRPRWSLGGWLQEPPRARAGG